MIEDYLNQSIILERQTGSPTGYGEAQYGAPATLPARIAALSRWFRGKDGNMQESDATVYLAPETQIGLDDRVTIDGVKRYVMGLRDVAALQDVAHVEIYLGRVPRGG